MKFSIIGADRDTGEDIELTVDAADEAAAQEVAHRKGIMVSRVNAVLAHRPSDPRIPQFAPRLEQGHVRGAPVINIAPPRRGNSLGVASLVLGIIAFLICWIPFINLIGVPLAALGFLLGLVGILVALLRSGASIGYPIAGTAVCVLSLVVAITITGMFVGGLQAASEGLAKDLERRSATSPTNSASPRSNSSTSFSSRSSSAATKWYEGGTLHKKSALEWQVASSKDKLATCSDFVATMWQNGDLKPSIANRFSTVDDIRPYAQELVDCLDAAFKPDPDPTTNRMLFANQGVSEFAAMGMVTMGWTK